MHFKSTLFLFLFVAYPFFMVGQSVNLSTQNARAIKYYNKALEEIRARDFNEAIFLYKKAIRSDRYFSEAYMRLGSTYTMLMETDSAYHYYDRYRKITPGDAIPAPMVLLLSRLYFERGEYAVADSTLSLLEENDWRNEPQDNLLRESIVFSRAHQGEASDLDIEVLPQAVNKFYTQYFPAVTIDNRTLFFTARQGLGLYDDEDLYQSVNIDGIWQEAQLVSRSVSSRSNEGACTISADGRTLIFTSCEEGRTFGSCDLYISMREGDVWAKPKNMGKAVNSKYWDSQPSLSADGTTLYFSSNRPGGLGQRDVWVSYLNGEEWSVPVNLG
ncbi:MAG: hypothetical protein OEY56_03080, partial [Cyclobacteriaceae bacterium]|nr:hypothetical protein [Cyclobacteriaceae bacterium]